MNGPTFVLSTGRSGTLALQRFLRRSKRVEAFHRYRGRLDKYWNDQSFVLEQNFAYYQALSEANENKKRLVVRLLRRSRGCLIDLVAKEGMGLVELNHEFSPFGSLLSQAFPEARFVHLFREPKSVITSFMTKFNPPPMELPAYMGTRFSLLGQYVLRHGYVRSFAKLGPRVLREYFEARRYDTHIHPFEKAGGRWLERQDMSPFEKTCWYWNAVNRSILNFLAELPEERKLQVNFEGFFEQASSESRSAFLRFVGADDLTLADAGEFFKARINTKDVHRVFPDSPEWNDSMLRTLERYCGDTMAQLGYTREQSSQAG